MDARAKTFLTGYLGLFGVASASNRLIVDINSNGRLLGPTALSSQAFILFVSSDVHLGRWPRRSIVRSPLQYWQSSANPAVSRFCGW